jgi:hypothetical protein
MRTQETLIVALYAAMGASYARNYAKRPPRLEGTPAFEPHPDDLADLLATSLAPANEAISVAVDGLVARGGPTPVNLGLPVNRNRLVLDELPVR